MFKMVPVYHSKNTPSHAIGRCETCGRIVFCRAKNPHSGGKNPTCRCSASKETYRPVSRHEPAQPARKGRVSARIFAWECCCVRPNGPAFLHLPPGARHTPGPDFFHPQAGCQKLLQRKRWLTWSLFPPCRPKEAEPHALRGAVFPPGFPQSVRNLPQQQSRGRKKSPPNRPVWRKIYEATRSRMGISRWLRKSQYTASRFCKARYIIHPHDLATRDSKEPASPWIVHIGVF